MAQRDPDADEDHDDGPGGSGVNRAEMKHEKQPRILFWSLWRQQSEALFEPEAYAMHKRIGNSIFLMFYLFRVTQGTESRDG